MNKVTDYCERRILEERQAATTASCDEAAIAHRQLARQYVAKVRAIRPKVKKATGKPHLSTLSLRDHQ